MFLINVTTQVTGAFPLFLPSFLSEWNVDAMPAVKTPYFKSGKFMLRPWETYLTSLSLNFISAKWVQQCYEVVVKIKGTNTCIKH